MLLQVRMLICGRLGTQELVGFLYVIGRLTAVVGAGKISTAGAVKEEAR